MSRKPSKQIARDDLNHERTREFSVLSRRLLECANQALRKSDFARQVSELLAGFSRSDAIEIRLANRGRLTCFQLTEDADPPFSWSTIPCARDANGDVLPCETADSDLELLCTEIARGNFDHMPLCSTKQGSVWIEDTREAFSLSSRASEQNGDRILQIGGEFRSLAIIPFSVMNMDTGLLILKARKPGFFSLEQMEFYEETAQILGIAFNHRSAQVALRERIKELTCLYGIAKISAKPNIALDDILQGTVELLPPGWLYPDIASARVVLDDRCYSTRGFEEYYQKLSAKIVVNGEERGAVQVAYCEKMPELDEGPFLKDERSLIDAVAGEISLIIERRQVEKERQSLHEQLRHADRLATIGQLAAGVAHELNEPLGSILGFAQLSNKNPAIPDQIRQDIDKIIAASLHGRDVIKKLMVFARQTASSKAPTNLNRIVEEGLFFFESRCAKADIELKRVLEPDLPDIVADRGQLSQVLVNLVVNSIQAMPDGGQLTIRTGLHDEELCLIVEDTGTGMDSEVLEKLFIPFFTTKDVNEGTGLGLSVVHGIVTSHGGTVSVDSKVGRGSRFTVRLPLAGKSGRQGETANAEE